MATPKTGIKIICENRKARFNFQITENFEAGLMLVGSEVKSLREGGSHLSDAYASVKNGEMWLLQAHIAPYKHASLVFNHDPARPRKLLLHKEEIDKLIGKINEKGFTLIPLKLYFKEGRVKVDLGLAKSKTHEDKRATIKKRETDREVRRALKNRR